MSTFHFIIHLNHFHPSMTTIKRQVIFRPKILARHYIVHTYFVVFRYYSLIYSVSIIYISLAISKVFTLTFYFVYILLQYFVTTLKLTTSTTSTINQSDFYQRFFCVFGSCFVLFCFVHTSFKWYIQYLFSIPHVGLDVLIYYL